jgi:hypothetical protein
MSEFEKNQTCVNSWSRSFRVCFSFQSRRFCSLTSGSIEQMTFPIRASLSLRILRPMSLNHSDDRGEWRPRGGKSFIPSSSNQFKEIITYFTKRSGWHAYNHNIIELRGQPSGKVLSETCHRFDKQHAVVYGEWAKSKDLLRFQDHVDWTTRLLHSFVFGHLLSCESEKLGDWGIKG